MILRPNLEKTLDGIRWAVVGAVATRAYMPERATQDLDIIVEVTSREETRRRLKAAGFIYIQELSIGGSLWKLPDNTLLDVVESNASWVSEALGKLQRDPQGLPVLSLPYLVLMKMQAGRTQDLADVSRMLGLASDSNCQQAREVLERFQPDQKEDFESLLYLGRLEIGRPL
jgi:hypothetical protein